MGSPNLTDSAFGPGPALNFETAVWERNSQEAISLWDDINALFARCPEAKKEDYDAVRAWSDFYGSDSTIESIEVRGPRDAINRFVDFSLVKGRIEQVIYPFDETPVFFDEAKNTRIHIKLKSGFPKVSRRVKIYVSPSNIEQTKTVEAEFSKTELIANLPLDTSTPDTISIRVDLESRLIEERQVDIKKIGNKIEITSFHLPIINDSEEVFLLVYTSKGCKEIECKLANDILLIECHSDNITKNHGFLRLYSKRVRTTNAFGYYRIRCRKRTPKVELRIACINHIPMSIFFREFENPLAVSSLLID